MTLLVFCPVILSFLLSSCTPRGEKSITSYNELILQFEVDQIEVPVGGVVRMRYAVRNTGERLWVIDSKDTPVLDIIVEKPPFGQILMTWSSQNPDKALHRVEWQPGETKLLELVWTPDEEFRYGRLVHLTGTLSKNSKIVQSVGVTICAGPACR